MTQYAGVMVRQEHGSEVIDNGWEGEIEEVINLHFDVTVSYVPPNGRDPYGSEYVMLGVMVRDGYIGRIDPDGYAQPCVTEPHVPVT